MALIMKLIVITDLFLKTGSSLYVSSMQNPSLNEIQNYLPLTGKKL